MTRLIALAIALSLTACAQAGDPWYTPDSPEPPCVPALAKCGNGNFLNESTCTEAGHKWHEEVTCPGSSGSATLDPAILEIFEGNKCMNCHDGSGGGSGSSGLDVSSIEGLLTGGVKAGPAVVPCDPEASPLLAVIQGGYDDGSVSVIGMPLGGAALDADAVETIRAWIADGAGTTCGPVTLPEIDAEIVQLFEDHSCIGCHGGPGGSGGLDMSSLQGLLDGGDEAGPAIVACDADASPLVQVVEGGITDAQGETIVAKMPLVGTPFDSDGIEMLRAWIDGGAGIETCSDPEPEPEPDPDPEPDPEPEPDPDPEPSVWTDEVRPILDTYCGGCHGTGGYAAPMFLDDTSLLDVVVANSYGSCDGLTGSACILVMLEEGLMPAFAGCDSNPDQPGICPTTDEIQTISDWVDAGAEH